MKNFFTILCITLAFLCSTSCDTKPGRTVICLVDLSHSIDSATTHWYEETIESSILSKLGYKDRLLVLPIDYGSQASCQEIFTIDFSKNDYSNEFAGLQEDEVKRNGHADSIKAAVRQFKLCFDHARDSRVAFAKGTDIFGAFKQAQKYGCPGCSTVIVVFSDMLQYTNKSKMNFEDHLNDTNDVNRLLVGADKADLSHTQVVVLTGIQRQMSPAKFNLVNDFWNRYIKGCNGQLVEYSSGAVTRLEELIAPKSYAAQ